MNFKDIIPTIKEILFVAPKDDITKGYLSTKSAKYQSILNCLERKEYDNSYLINEPLIQEFSFEESPANNECVLTHKVKFSNLGIGSTHFRDVHESDLKVISKLSMLEFLSRSNIGLNLYKDFKYVENNSQFKKLDWSNILDKDKNFSGHNVKIPFVLALILDRIKRTALDTKDIFRKSTNIASLREVFKELYKILSSDTNYIVNIFNQIYDIEPIFICSLMKTLLKNFNPLIPINILKFIYSLPAEIKEPELLVLLYQCLMIQIPNPERNILECILELLGVVVKHQLKNNMGLRSISTLFAPVLLNPDQSSVNSAIDVLVQMIHYRKYIFLISRNVLNIHRNDNISNENKFTLKKHIGKKPFLDENSKLVVLSHYQARSDVDFIQDDKYTNQETFDCKYNERLISLPFDKESTTMDIVNLAIKESENSTNYRLFENRGNIYQSCLHPQMKLWKVLEDNRSAKFVIDFGPEHDLVNSTMKILYFYLNIDVA